LAIRFAEKPTYVLEGNVVIDSCNLPVDIDSKRFGLHVPRNIDILEVAAGVSNEP
jgi:hypothetical protein